jgi:VWFA-related protein
MLREFGIGVWIIVLALTASIASGQSVPPVDSGLTIHSSVHEVALDLVVRDSKGRIVKNLKPEDVAIYEDGVKQELRSLRLVPGREVLQQEEKQEAVVTPGAPKPAPARVLPAVNLLCIVFHNLDPDSKIWALAAADEFLKSNLEPGTWVATFNLGANAKLEPMLPFTENREEAIKALHNVTTGTNLDFMNVASAVLNSAPTMMSITSTVSGSGAGTTAVTSLDILGGDINPQSINGAEVSTGQGAKILRGQAADQRQEFGHIANMQIADQTIAMIDALAPLPGHKTVLLLSPGMTSTGDPDYFEKILARARKANITIYAVDTNGLSQNSNVLAGNGAVSYAAGLSKMGNSAAALKQQMRAADTIVDAVRSSNPQAGMRALAEGTGGSLIGGTNDLKKSFQHVLEDLDTHYEAVFHPSSEKLDGRLRTIEVKMARADLNVENRKGFFDLPDLDGKWIPAPYELTGLAALNVNPVPHAFDFKSAIYTFRPKGDSVQHAVAFEVPARVLSALAEPEQHRHQVHFTLFGVVKNADGQIVDRFGQDVPTEIADANLASARKASFTYTHPLDLGPGNYTVETAVVDQEGKRASTSTLHLMNTKQAGVGLSSVMLVRDVEKMTDADAKANPFEFQGKRVVPELRSAFQKDAHPVAYFVVYPDKAQKDKPKIKVDFLVGGKLVGHELADLPAADATGAIPMVVPAPTRPGNCELRIMAMQGDTMTMQSVTYSVLAQ